VVFHREAKVIHGEEGQGMTLVKVKMKMDRKLDFSSFYKLLRPFL